MRTAAKHALTALTWLVAASALGQTVDDRQFLSRASDRVAEYIETFHDLTAEETATIQIVDRTGATRMERTVLSSLIIYRSQTNAEMAVEYRDVEAVDRIPVKDRSERALKLLEHVSDAKSAVDELERITKEGSRYNHEFVSINLTLHEAVPLMLNCRHAFSFAYAGDEVVRGIPTRMYYYEQVQPCDVAHYNLHLPSDYEKGQKWHQGRLWLETATSRVVREERIVFSASTNEPNARAKVVNVWFDYVPSTFGILVPSKIAINTYAFTGMALPTGPATAPRTLVTQAYGPFSKFDVTVQQHVVYPDTVEP